MEFLTIRQTAKRTGVREHVLRRLCKQRKLPGFYSGSRFYVRLDKLEPLLDAMAENHDTVPTVTAPEPDAAEGKAVAACG